MDSRFSCFLIGSESLLIQCAEVLVESGHEIRGIISDAAPVRAWAEARSLPLIDPKSDLVQVLEREPFDYLFSITHLAMLDPALLALPARLAINFHDGPLPRYAGLNVPVWALLNGEAQHGVTWHVMTEAADEGDILAQRLFDMAPGETSLTLNTRCWEAGIESFSELVGALAEGRAERRPQDLSQRSYFARSDRPEAACCIRWDRPAEEIVRLVRALDFGGYANPVGAAKLLAGGQVFAVGEAEIAGEEGEGAPGTIATMDDRTLAVRASHGVVALRRLTTPRGEAITPRALGERAGLAAGARLPQLSDEDASRLSELDAELGRHEPFWVRRLGRLAPLELPFSDRGEAQAGDADFVRLALDLVPAGAEASLERSVSIIATWLGRVTRQPGFHLRARTPGLVARSAGLEAFYADFVPLRVALDGDVPFDAAVAGMREELDRIERRGAVLHDVGGRFPELNGLPCDSNVAVDVVANLAEFTPQRGVALSFAVREDGAEALLALDRGAFDAAAPEALRAQLGALATGAAEDSSTALNALPLLDPALRERMLVEWNDTAVAWESDRCIHELIASQVERTPDAPALFCEGEELSYRELDRRANQLAHHLAGLGVGAEVLVGVHLDRSLDMLVTMLAILKAGGAYVPLDPAFPRERLAFMIADSEVPVLVTRDSLRGELPTHAARVVTVDGDRAAIEAESESAPATDVSSASRAYVIYTSGSTGRPKGVEVEHRNVVNFFRGMDDRIPHDPPGSWLAVTSLSFDISVLELLWTLARGFKVVLHVDRQQELTAEARSPQASSQPMDFSVFYFASDEGESSGDKYRLLLEGARFADQHDFSAVWTPERHFHAFGGLYPNAAVTGAALASVTERVQVRSGSVVLPLHHPIRVTEEWAVVDNLSGGRVGVAFAAGWQPNDFVLRPENFADAKDRMFDSIEEVKALWRGEERTYPGPKGDVTLRTMPRPIQPELPVWVTTAGNADTYERAARAGHRILTHLLGQSIEGLAEKIALYRKSWREARHPGQGQITLMLHTFVSDDEDSVRETVREPMKDYLRSAISLVKEAAWTFPTFRDMSSQTGQSPAEIFEGGLSQEEMDALLNHALDRYYETSGLFGTPDGCVALVEQLKGIGVDEVACQIDFGVPTDVVLDNLKYLAQLRELCNPAASGASSTSHTIPDLVANHRVTHLQCTPSMAAMLLMDDSTRRAFEPLQTVMIGGEALPLSVARDLAQATRAKVLNMYGPTETTIWSSVGEVDAAADAIPLGTPIANTQLYVVDERLEPVPPGVPGELLIGGEGVVRGYLKRGELTAERFVSDRFRPGSDARLYRTGDLARHRSDGTLDFLGRIDHQVKIRGYRIELGEIETRLGEHPLVREAVVIAREDTPGDKRLVAYVVAAGAGQLDDAALREHLRGVLPEYMVPMNFVPLARLPLTPNAKVDRKALPAPSEQKRRAGPVSGARPENETQQLIAEIWREALQVGEVGLDDNFFDLGGHSLLAVKVHRDIKARVERPLSITDLFRLPTIRALADHLEGNDDSAERVAERSSDRAATRRAAMAKRMSRRRRGRSGDAQED